ncbi:MAG: hypothetical protein H2057_05445 [Alphaproteobacteria bacterium]|nr:hypothetical protein [Alphaproteobacteria bacterium]
MKKIILTFSLLCFASYQHAQAEPITLAALGLGGLVLTKAAISKGLHCNAVCNRVTCSTPESDLWSAPELQGIKRKLESLSDREISGRFGLAHWCAKTCNSGSESIAFSIPLDGGKTKNIPIAVKKFYKDSRGLKNCVRGYNAEQPNATRVNPNKEVAVYNDAELQKIKDFAAENNYQGYLSYVTENIDFQPPVQWDVAN